MRVHSRLLLFAAVVGAVVSVFALHASATATETQVDVESRTDAELEAAISGVLADAASSQRISSASTIHRRKRKWPWSKPEPPKNLPVCMFVHGTGAKKRQANTADKADSLSDYFGDIEKKLYAQNICKAKFPTLDQHTRTWNQAEVQKELCNRVKEFKPRVIIAHSNGNLIIGAAILNQVAGCTDIVGPSEASKPNSILWIALQPPIRGSPAAAQCVTFCKNGFSIWEASVKDFLSNYLCVCKDKQPSVGIKGLTPTWSPVGPKFNDIAALMKTKVSTIFCGISNERYKDPDAWVNVPHKDIALSMLASEVDFGKDEVTKTKSGKTYVAPFSGNDGMVPFQSCKGDFDDSKWSTNPSSDQWVAPYNHLAGTGLYGGVPQVFIIDATKRALKKQGFKV